MAIISKPTTFTSNTTISSSAVNDDFDTLYNAFNGSVDAVNLGSSAVTTAKIADSNVTTAKLADGSVTAEKLTASAITLGSAQIVASVGPTSTSVSDTDIAGLSVSVTVPAGGRRVKVTAVVAYQQSGGIGTVYSALKIKEGSTVLQVSPVVPSIAAVDHPGIVIASFTPTAASHTYKLSIAQNTTGPTFTIDASSTAPAFILVELI